MNLTFFTYSVSVLHYTDILVIVNIVLHKIITSRLGLICSLYEQADPKLWLFFQKANQDSIPTHIAFIFIQCLRT